jgi:uncharacterized damage-inducible protein DinB
VKAKPWAGMPRRPNGIYIPRFRNVKEKMTNGFIRGYGYQGGVEHQLRHFGAPGFGKSYKDAVRNGRTSIGIGLWAECLPRKENRVEIDKNRVDAWGVPVLKINMEWGDNEKKALARRPRPGRRDARSRRRQKRPHHRADTPSPASAFTKSAPPAWATIPKPAWSTSTARRTMSRTSSSPTALAGSPSVARTHPHHDGHHRPRLRLHHPRIRQKGGKMPEEHYGFQPTPEVRTFGQLIGHIADAQNRMCASALGEQPPQGSVEKTKTTKADLQAAVKESFAYCDKAFDAVTDANAAEMVPFFRGERPKLGVLSFLVAHSYEHYGNLVTYMRIKGLVPPSSER